MTQGTAHIVGIVDDVKKGRDVMGTHWILVDLKTTRTEISVKAFGPARVIEDLFSQIETGMEVAAKGRIIGKSSHYIKAAPGDIRIVATVERPRELCAGDF